MSSMITAMTYTPAIHVATPAASAQTSPRDLALIAKRKAMHAEETANTSLSYTRYRLSDLAARKIKATTLQYARISNAIDDGMYDRKSAALKSANRHYLVAMDAADAIAKVVANADACLVTANASLGMESNPYGAYLSIYTESLAKAASDASADAITAVANIHSICSLMITKSWKRGAFIRFVDAKIACAKSDNDSDIDSDSDTITDAFTAAAAVKAADVAADAAGLVGGYEKALVKATEEIYAEFEGIETRNDNFLASIFVNNSNEAAAESDWFIKWYATKLAEVEAIAKTSVAAVALVAEDVSSISDVIASICE